MGFSQSLLGVVIGADTIQKPNINELHVHLSFTRIADINFRQ
jgi:hypothetical protein